MRSFAASLVVALLLVRCGGAPSSPEAARGLTAPLQLDETLGDETLAPGDETPIRTAPPERCEAETPGEPLSPQSERVTPLAEHPEAPAALTVNVLGWRHPSSAGDDTAAESRAVRGCAEQLLSTALVAARRGARAVVVEGLPTSERPHRRVDGPADLRSELLATGCFDLYGFESDGGETHRALLALSQELRGATDPRRKAQLLARFQRLATVMSAQTTRRSFQALETALRTAVERGDDEISLLIGAKHLSDLEQVLDLWRARGLPDVELLRLRFYPCDAAR